MIGIPFHTFFHSRWTEESFISVYNTCTLPLTKIYNVDANLDAFDSIISGNESHHFI